jgi:hypothetical protein
MYNQVETETGEPMSTPTLMTARRFSGPRRLRLQILFAKAFEALAETYRLQAAEFVRRLRVRLSVEEALDRYFREVGVPAAMVETVRARALVALAGSVQETSGAEPETREGTSWSHLRPELLLGALKRRAHSIEAMDLDCRMAASLSDEAVTATHVAMALETVELLSQELPPDDAIMHYIRYFDLPSLEAQIVFRRTLAQWADREASFAIATAMVCSPSARLELPMRLVPGLRMIG